MTISIAGFHWTKGGDASRNFAQWPVRNEASGTVNARCVSSRRSPPTTCRAPLYLIREYALARRALLLLLIALLAACAGSERRDMPSALSASRANAVSIHAIGLVGTPYRYGGNTPAGGFDCSGLVGYVFRESASIVLPRTTRELAKLSASDVATDRLQVGDLVLFGNRRRIDHVGIYVGEQRFVHAPSSGGTVRLDSLNAAYWKKRLLGGKRPIQ